MRQYFILASVIIFAAVFVTLFFLYSGSGQAPYNDEGQLPPTGNFGTETSVGIMDQAEAIMYEEDRQDNIFELDNNASGDLSYNGTYGGTKAGYDTFDNQTQLFTLENVGSTEIDVLISAQDFSDGASFINVGFASADFQIYIPGVGWRNIPDNNVGDLDGNRDTAELCIADSLEVGSKISGFDFKVNGQNASRYISFVKVAAYDTDVSNLCSAIGSYVYPERVRW